MNDYEPSLADILALPPADLIGYTKMDDQLGDGSYYSAATVCRIIEARRKMFAYETRLEDLLAPTPEDELALIQMYQPLYYRADTVIRMIEAEREACAKACEAEAVDHEATGSVSDFAYNMALKHASDSIRARGRVKL